MGGNIFSPIKDDTQEYWQGSGIYPSKYVNNYDGITGKYLRTTGKVETALRELLLARLKVKDKPNESLAIKILINTQYGLLGSPKFKSVYSKTAASDVTAMARRSILHARTILEENGYECIYTDTDSCYVKDKTNDKERLKKVISFIVDEQRKSMNIPCDLHDFKIECFIKRMYFFRDDKGVFIKKHYIYVTDEDELVIKGISVKRGNCSPIAKKFFYDVIKPKIMSNTYIPYKAQELLAELKQFIKGKEEMLLKRYRLKPLESYKIAEGKDESTALNAQLSKKYGAGEHYLLINKRIGVGKGNKYCKLEELKEKYGDYYLDQIVYESYLSDLSEFIEWKDRRNIHETDRKRVKQEKKDG